jgi:Na+-driven multidrug efflux pump
LPDRVRGTFRVAATMAAAAMAVLFVICRLWPEALVKIFNDDPAVVAVGAEYLVIVAWNFVPSGIVFVSSSMFQAMGNTVPPLVSSFLRTCMAIIPAVALSHTAGFALRWIWYMSALAVLLHMGLNLLFLRNEYRRKLSALATPAAAPAVAAAG